MFLTRMGSAVCHRMAERSFLWGQGTMPLCARCTGIYVGVLLAFCFLLLKKRMDAGRPFSKGQAMLTALMILPIGIDGLGSYLGFWESNQLMRVLSGSLVGAVVPGFLLLAVNFDPAQGSKQPIYAHTTELLLLLLLSAGLGFGLWLGLPLAGVLAVASVLGRLCLAASEKSLWQEKASVLANFFGGGVSGSVCDRRLDAVKKELRQRALATRDALEKREEKSRQIAAHILESAAYQNTERIFTFVSMGSEVETEEIIRQAWQDGKAVAVPKTEKHREMHFYEIRSLAELSEGRFGVREPKGGVVCIPKEGDLLLVPGLLFDGKKNRLGYGGGYYDTYFAKHKEGKRIGLAFAAQRFAEELPTEETDVPLDAVITENGWEE